MELFYYLYCIASAYTQQHGQRKLGLTMNPVHRMSVFNTGDAPGIGLDKRYEGLWQVKATSRDELKQLEAQLHERFRSSRKYRSNGNPTEWFEVSLEEVTEFLNSQSFVIRRLTIEEVRTIHQKADLSTVDVESNKPSLKDEFFETFLDGATPRRIQNELWDLWETISAGDKYKGIVQWATGTGKTIALLMLFLLSANESKKKGKIFRGLLIAPKNDIFDTIIHHIRKLSKWGITVYEGHNARLSSLTIPRNKPVLITATHASLTTAEGWSILPEISHCHYDEVHRITGDEFYALLNVHLTNWSTQFLTGTSATPITCAMSQHKKITELFGSPLNILHKCDVDEAIMEGWIAQPRFSINVLSKILSRPTMIRAFVNTLMESIMNKRKNGPWQGGKVIAYLPFRSEVCEAVSIAKELSPTWQIYSAVEGAGALDDSSFVSDTANGEVKILFACERYREGSDIKGLEMTAILMGNSIGANVLLQIAGRALRNDYKGKEGWCLIVKPCEEGVTVDDVFDSIVLQIMEFIGKDTSNILSNEKIRQVVDRFFGTVGIEGTGKMYSIDETVNRIQAMYMRRVTDPKEKYETIRNYNRQMNYRSKDEYLNATDSLHNISEPKVYFDSNWTCWYDFLGIDTSSFPQTKYDWVNRCKELGILTWEQYKKVNDPSLPANPIEMYENYTNWNKEFEIPDEIVWT